MAFESRRISLLTLPTEILYRICDFLDTETLLLSVRCVCVRLHAISMNYDRYKICVRSLSTMHICRWIRSENVLSFDFSDKNSSIDWIGCFLPMFERHAFTRLRSLWLSKVNVNDLSIILHHIVTHCMLTSLSIDSSIAENDDETWQLLLLVVEQPTLRHLYLSFDLTMTNKLSWPAHCTVNKLLLNKCTFQQLYSILQNSPHLTTLIMDQCYMKDIDGMGYSETFPQVTSLTLNELQMTMDKLEFLLSLLPSLTHLDLTSSGRPYGFVQRLSQWEAFIRRKLPHLFRLELCLFCYCLNWESFDSLISAFRTSFWLEEKRWFVTCQFRDDWTSSFTVFTSSACATSSRPQEHDIDKIVCYQSLKTTNEQPF